MHGDLGLGDGRGPVPDGHHRAGVDDGGSRQEADERRVGAEPLERDGRAEADLPAERGLTGREALAAKLELGAHPPLDARVAHGISYPAASSEPAPLQPQTRSASSLPVLSNPCQCPRGVKTTSPASDGSVPSSV